VATVPIHSSKLLVIKITEKSLKLAKYGSDFRNMHVSIVCKVFFIID